jgi:hypothetical protein
MHKVKSPQEVAQANLRAASKVRRTMLAALVATINLPGGGLDKRAMRGLITAINSACEREAAEAQAFGYEEDARVG